MSLDAFTSLHSNMLSSTKGIFSDSFQLVPASTITSKFVIGIIHASLRTSINFTKGLQAAFALADPQSAKRH